MNSTAAVAVLVALHVVQSVMVVPKLWRAASAWHLQRLAIGGLIGCPVGLFILQRLDVRALKLSLGVLILAFLVLFIVRGQFASASETTPTRGWLVTLTGMASGTLTALLVMPGPPLMVYLASAPQSKDASRALSLTFFALCYVSVLALATFRGNLGRVEWLLVATLAPAVIVGTLAGSALAGGFSEARYRLAILTLMLLSGLGAIASAVLG